MTQQIGVKFKTIRKMYFYKPLPYYTEESKRNGSAPQGILHRKFKPR